MLQNAVRTRDTGFAQNHAHTMRWNSNALRPAGDFGRRAAQQQS